MFFLFGIKIWSVGREKRDEIYGKEIVKLLQTQSDSFVKYCFNFLVFTQVYFPELEKEYNKKNENGAGLKWIFC